MLVEAYTIFKGLGTGFADVVKQCAHAQRKRGGVQMIEQQDTAIGNEEMIEAPASRIVALSSIGHKGAGIHFDDLTCGGDGGVAYGQSKLACLLFGDELDRRLRAAGKTIKALSVHPGGSESGLFTDMSDEQLFADVPHPADGVDDGPPSGRIDGQLDIDPDQLAFEGGGPGPGPSPFAEGLNPDQLDAVVHGDGPLLVLERDVVSHPDHDPDRLGGDCHLGLKSAGRIS